MIKKELTQETFKLVPSWVEFIAVDDDGMAVGYNHEPVKYGCVFICREDSESMFDKNVDYIFLDGVYDTTINLLERK